MLYTDMRNGRKTTFVSNFETYYFMSQKFCWILLIIMALGQPLSAQFTRSTRMVGATVGSAFFNSGKYTYTVPPPTQGSSQSVNSLGVSLGPGMGWFISDKTAIGALLNVTYRYDKDIKADANNVTYFRSTATKFSFLAGGFVRNYFSNSGSFLPFGQVSLAAGIGSSSHDGFNYGSSPVFKEVFKGKSSSDFTVNAGILMGFTKMFNPHIGLDITAGYLYSYNKAAYKTTSNRDVDIDGSIDETTISDITTKYTNHGFTIGVGFQLFLGREK